MCPECYPSITKALEANKILGSQSLTMDAQQNKLKC